MKVILAGIEYVGSTTISKMLSDWKLENMGEPFFMGLIHDHSKLPHTSGHPDDTTLEEQKQILNLSPKLKEMYHRYGMYYHLHHYVQEDDLSVGFHIEEAVYARRYYGYGLDGEQFDRNNVFVSIEDIEDVMADYQYFISKSDIGPVVKVDTSIDSPEDTLEKVVTLLDPYFTKTDLERIENHKG